MLSALFLAASGRAQGVESVTDVIAALGEEVSLLEAQNYQITDITVGIAFAGRGDPTFPVDLPGESQVAFVGIGDGRRILDLDIEVYDGAGRLLGRDDGEGNRPAVEFPVPATGTYEVRVHPASLAADAAAGFYSLTTAFQAGRPPVTVADTFAAMSEAAALMESQGFQVIVGEWETIEEHGSRQVRAWLPRSDECIAVAVASPLRARRLHLYVGDADGNLLGYDQENKQLGFVSFVPGADGEYRFEMEAKRLRRRVTDAHAAVLVGCRGF